MLHRYKILFIITSLLQSHSRFRGCHFMYSCWKRRTGRMEFCTDNVFNYRRYNCFSLLEWWTCYTKVKSKYQTLSTIYHHIYINILNQQMQSVFMGFDKTWIKYGMNTYQATFHNRSIRVLQPPPLKKKKLFSVFKTVFTIFSKSSPCF